MTETFETGSFWTYGPKWYARLRGRHKALWKFLPELIREFHVRNLLEVGGGDGWLGQFVELHRNFEVNLATVRKLPKGLFGKTDMVDANFLQIPEEHVAGRKSWDMVLAAAVLEHMPGFQTGLDRMLRVGAPLTVATFFLGLRREKELWVRRKSSDRRDFWSNQYAAVDVLQFVRARGFRTVVLPDEIRQVAFGGSSTESAGRIKGLAVLFEIGVRKPGLDYGPDAVLVVGRKVRRMEARLRALVKRQEVLG